MLYAFEMHRHNWQRAATYIYLYSALLRTEAALKDHQRRSLILQERLNGLSAAINALHLVHPAYAWIDPSLEGVSLLKEHYPSKKARLTVHEQGKYSCQGISTIWIKHCCGCNIYGSSLAFGKRKILFDTSIISSPFCCSGW